MDYSEINKFVLENENAQAFSDCRVWKYDSFNGCWVNTKGQFLGDQFMHVISNGFPDWSPEIRSYSQLKTKLIYFFSEVPIWQLGDKEWNLLDVPVNEANQNAVYIIGFASRQPIYNPMQDEIAKLILKGEYRLFRS